MLTLRRLWMRRYGSERGECPVRPLEEYSPDDQAIMMRAIKAALIAADPENVAKTIERIES
ncbi:hypothetical protein Y590_25450 (plasmid) [Methylobacterium sp. AMS5]|nr:hypothetical protein Y590_25450 [Methylobacterium sp. AMS5]